MDEFRNILKGVIRDEFGSSQRALAEKACVNHSLISRIISDKRGAAPEIVGKIAGVCSRPNRHALIATYLQAVAAETKLNVEVVVTLA